MTRIHRTFWCMGLALLMGMSAAPAQTGGNDVARQAVAAAASRDAIESLRQQVLQMVLSGAITVGDEVKGLGVSDGLSQRLGAAKAVGGPRWIDDRTCQVRMELAGGNVADFLLAAAGKHPEKSAVPIDILKSQLRSWSNLTWFAIGTSAGGETIEAARPGNGAGVWAGVSEDARRKAIADARQDAVNHVLDAIAPLPLGSAMVIRDALVRPVVGAAVNEQLIRSPVTKVEFFEDLSVGVTVAPTPELIVNALRAGMARDLEFSRNVKVDWNAVGQEIAGQTGLSVGRAKVTERAPVRAIEIPAQPPAWVNRVIQTDGVAAGPMPPLKVARLAEGAAVGKLQAQLMALPITATASVGDAAKADANFAEAVERGLRHAHTFKVEYRADGSVLVRMQLDLRDVWGEINAR